MASVAGVKTMTRIIMRSGSALFRGSATHFSGKREKAPLPAKPNCSADRGTNAFLLIARIADVRPTRDVRHADLTPIVSGGNSCYYCHCHQLGGIAKLNREEVPPLGERAEKAHPQPGRSGLDGETEKERVHAVPTRHHQEPGHDPPDRLRP